jgi:hypothetical protein
MTMTVEESNADRAARIRGHPEATITTLKRTDMRSMCEDVTRAAEG